MKVSVYEIFESFGDSDSVEVSKEKLKPLKKVNFEAFKIKVVKW